MYYRQGIEAPAGAEKSPGLSRKQMERARKGFFAVLGKLRFGREFIANNADELLAIAHTEYVRALDKGVEIEDPIAWMIHCAWRRTQNLLTTINSRPQTVSSEKLAELVDESRPTPDQIAEDTHRTNEVHRAIGELSENQRALIYLTYFEEISVREAARRLGWTPSKALRCHRSALKKLKGSLGISSSDELEIPIGLAAWLAIDSHSGWHLPAGVEAFAEAGMDWSGRAWGRIQDLGRRLPLGGGGDAAGAIATSGGGRGLGACLAVAAACIAGAGAVGPGLGVTLPGGHDSVDKAPTSVTPKRVEPEISSPSASVAPASASPSEAPATQRSPNARPVKAQRAPQPAKQRAADEQVRQQTDAFARAASESPQPSAAPEAAPPPSNAPAKSVTQASSQFGAFK